MTSGVSTESLQSPLIVGSAEAYPIPPNINAEDLTEPNLRTTPTGPPAFIPILAAPDLSREQQQHLPAGDLDDAVVEHTHQPAHTGAEPAPPVVEASQQYRVQLSNFLMNDSPADNSVVSGLAEKQRHFNNDVPNEIETTFETEVGYNDLTSNNKHEHMLPNEPLYLESINSISAGWKDYAGEDKATEDHAPAVAKSAHLHQDLRPQQPGLAKTKAFNKASQAGYNIPNTPSWSQVKTKEDDLQLDLPTAGIKVITIFIPHQNFPCTIFNFPLFSSVADPGDLVRYRYGKRFVEQGIVLFVNFI